MESTSKARRPWFFFTTKDTNGPKKFHGMNTRPRNQSLFYEFFRVSLCFSWLKKKPKTRL